MEEIRYKKEPIFLAGDDKLSYTIAVCLLRAGHPVKFYTRDHAKAVAGINLHVTDLFMYSQEILNLNDIEIITHLDSSVNCAIAIAITSENISEKKSVINLLEKVIPNEAIIAINTESISLSDIQQGCNSYERIMGVNWVEPAHTTYFLEIISNENTPERLISKLYSLAKSSWQKDPYIAKKDYGIRSRMMCAMVREAFYLIEKGYVNVNDIDRACKNDAGYYLPFAGNFRYMDLMGTSAYGMVMKDLNPELSKEQSTPDFFNKTISEGGLGMENNHGFYNYKDGEAEKEDELFRKFSYQIQEIIARYPVNYIEEKV